MTPCDLGFPAGLKEYHTCALRSGPDELGTCWMSTLLDAALASVHSRISSSQKTMNLAQAGLDGNRRKGCCKPAKNKLALLDAIGGG